MLAVVVGSRIVVLVSIAQTRPHVPPKDRPILREHDQTVLMSFGFPFSKFQFLDYL